MFCVCWIDTDYLFQFNYWIHYNILIVRQASCCKQFWSLKNILIKIDPKNSNNTSNFQPLEVVDRGSETQLQLGENLNFIMSRFGGYFLQVFSKLCLIIMLEKNQSSQSVNEHPIHSCSYFDKCITRSPLTRQRGSKAKSKKSDCLLNTHKIHRDILNKGYLKHVTTIWYHFALRNVSQMSSDLLDDKWLKRLLKTSLLKRHGKYWDLFFFLMFKIILTLT